MFSLLHFYRAKTATNIALFPDADVYIECRYVSYIMAKYGGGFLLPRQRQWGLIKSEL